MFLPALLLVGCTGLTARLVGVDPGEGAARRQPELELELSDGVRLDSDLYLPRGEGPWPAILIRTPYGKRNRGQFMPFVSRLFARHGYAVLVQDVRGRFGSQGDWRPFYSEARDGREVLEWIRAQPWSDGAAGTFGFSYFGYTQWALATQRPEGLRAAMLGITSSDMHSWFYHGGAFRLELAGSWALKIADPAKNREDDEAERERLFWHLPPDQADEAVLETLPYYDEWLAADVPGVPYSSWLPPDAADQLEVPALLVTGWFDIFMPQQLHDFQALVHDPAAPAAQSALLVGPWNHALGFSGQGDMDLGPQASFFSAFEQVLGWFDHHLRGSGPVPTWGPVRSFQLGQNRWQDHAQWPPAGAQALTLALTPDGGLDRETDAEGSMSFTYDPRDPVPTVGGNNYVESLSSPRDQVTLDARQDILRFVAPPLGQPLRLAGPAEARLCVSTSVDDTAFTAKLVDVDPLGLALNMLDGITLLSRRDGADHPQPAIPGQRYALSISLGQTDWTLAAGHSLRLDISSSNFPRYARHPNQFGPWARISELRDAEQTLHFDAECSPELAITVLEGVQ